MAGGIAINGKPFALNPKCIFMSILLAGGYWWLPPKSYWVLAGILWSTYVGLSWYDAVYDCNDKMKPTVFPLGRIIFLPFKPQSYKAEMQNLTVEQIKIMDRVDHVAIFTLLFCAAVVIITRWHRS